MAAKSNCSESQIAEFVEFYNAERRLNRNKLFGRNELYSFMNHFYGMCSPSFSDKVFNLFCNSENLEFKNLVRSVASRLEASNYAHMVELFVRAYTFDNPHVGAKVSDLDRLLRGVKKGRIKLKCDEIRRKIHHCAELTDVKKEAKKRGHLSLPEIELYAKTHWHEYTK